MRSIKIISDGTPFGTRVVDAATGEEIKGITRVEWEVGVNQLATAKITFAKVEAEVTVDRVRLVSVTEPTPVRFGPAGQPSGPAGLPSTCTFTRTFYERWIHPLLHPVTIPFEPWVRYREGDPTLSVMKAGREYREVHPAYVNVFEKRGWKLVRGPKE